MIKRQSFYERHEGLILGGSAVLVVLVLWEYIWIKQWVSPLFFSGPLEIAKQFWYLLTEGSLRADILFSGKNFILGLTAATIAGVVLGVLIGWYKKIRLIFDPFLNALYATPRLAMMPLIIIWFGTDWKSKVFIVFLSSFFPILVKMRGYKVLETPVKHSPRFAGTAKYGFSNRALRAFIDLLGIRWMKERYLRYQATEVTRNGR